MNIQEELLQKLNEYGDNFLETHEVKKKKNKIKNKDAPETPVTTDKFDNEQGSSNIQTTSDRTAKKKKKGKKKKKRSEIDSADNTKPKAKHNSAGGAVRHIEQIKKELGLEDFKEEQLRKKEEEEMKKKRLEMLNKKNQPEVVVFHSRKPKKQDDKSNVKDSAHTEKESDDELDLEAARYDVRKFGISGIKGEQKEDAMKDLLIRLGAKPPKNKFYNYKEYQDLKQREKNEFLEQKSWDRAVGNEVKGKGKSVKRKRDKNDIGAVDGQIGKFKSGVLFLKKNDIHSIKKAKVKR